MAETAWDADLQLAHQLADTARLVSLSFFRREIIRWSKRDGSLATEADIAVEKKLRDRLAIERPGDAFLGEEGGQTGASARRWIVDAIDGTVEFASGSSEWSTLIALECDDRVVVGVCDQPANRRRYWAVVGKGALYADSSGLQRALRVSETRDLSSARSYVPPDQWLPDDRALRVATALAGATRRSPQMNHPALQVAAGDYEIAVFFGAGPWDLAAPSLIVEEAGGRFSDVSGRRDVFSGTAVFSNGNVHEAVLQLTAFA